jgi:hypothetical protein
MERDRRHAILGHGGADATDPRRYRAFYLFLVHTFTADKPFVRPSLFADRNPFDLAKWFLADFRGSREGL